MLDKQIRRPKGLRIHVICWSLFILYESLVSYSYTKTNPHFLDYFGHYTLNIGLFYLNAYIIETAIGSTDKRFDKLVVFVFLELGLYIFIKYLMYKTFIVFHIYGPDQITSLFITESIYRAIYFIGLSTGYWFALSSINQQKLIAQLEKDKLKVILLKEQAEKKTLESENTSLKAQINPHFLFNILGAIHNTLLKYSHDAAEMVALLSDMMRYALQKPNQDNKVNLADEIEQITNYVSINQYRYQNKLFLNFHTYGDIGQIKIISLLLITIVENVFKYADLSDQNHPAQIIIRADDNILKLYINNRKRKQRIMEGFGIGISNVKKRLEHNYSGKYMLNIEDTESAYTLTLSLEVND